MARLRNFTDRQLIEALRACEFNVKDAAELLGVGKTSVYCAYKLLAATPGLETWLEYERTRDQRLRNELVVRYRPAAREIAAKVVSRLPDFTDRAELESAVDLALLGCVERFDVGRGVKFETFMTPRIRGAVLDRLRLLDSVPRSARELQARRRAAEAGLRQELQRRPSDEELLERLGWTPRKLAASRPRKNMSLEKTVAHTLDGLEVRLEEFLAESRPKRDGEYFFLRVSRGLEFEERIVLYLYFLKKCSQVEIGKVLGVSESRVSQLKKAGLSWIRDTQGDEELLQEFDESKTNH